MQILKEKKNNNHTTTSAKRKLFSRHASNVSTGRYSVDSRQQGYIRFTSGKERAHERVEYLFMRGLSLDDATRSQGGRGVPVGEPANGNKRGKRI